MRTELEKEEESWKEELNKRETELDELKRTRDEQEGENRRSRDEKGDREGEDNEDGNRSGRAPLPRRQRSDSNMSQSDGRRSQSPQQANGDKGNGANDEVMLECELRLAAIYYERVADCTAA